MILPTSVTSRRGEAEESRSALAPSAAIGMALLAHAAAIGALLMFKPPQPFATPPEPFEVSILIEDDPRPGIPPRTSPSDGSIGWSAMPLPGPNRPDVAATASPSSWPVDAGRLFDVPGLSTSRFHAPSPVLDQLGAMLDCLAAEGSARRQHRPRPPCAFADVPFRAPGTMFPTNVRESNVRAGDDYRNFETIRPLFDESLFPDKVPPANRAFEKRIMGLFR
jgi:hypothetical protein